MVLTARRLIKIWKKNGSNRCMSRVWIFVLRTKIIFAFIELAILQSRIDRFLPYLRDFELAEIIMRFPEKESLNITQLSFIVQRDDVNEYHRTSDG